LPTADDTVALGAQLATLVRAGDTILLHGGYGAGKTCLARGFIRRWFADDPDLRVTSPSYLIDNAYPDEHGTALQPGVAVHHIDLWRIPEGKAHQLLDLPHIFSECISLIEWPQRLGAANMPSQPLEVYLEHAEGYGGAAGDQPVDVDDAGDEDEDEPRNALVVGRAERWGALFDALSTVRTDRAAC